MSSDAPPLLKPRPRYGRWILLGLTVLLAPAVIIGVIVFSMFQLNGDAAVLRREVMAATDTDWDTKVQMSAGGITLAAVRTGLLFVDNNDMDDARLALAAVRSASVGVYERSGRAGKWSRKELLTRTDERMRKRGMSRMVGVTEDDQAVLVYLSDSAEAGDRMDLCIAVVDGDDLVIVSTKVDGKALMELAEQHLPEGRIREQLKMTKLAL